MSRPLIGGERKVHKTLPDARPRRMTGFVRSPFGALTRAYCVNCGAPGGLTLEATYCEMFYLCENCEHHGTLAAMASARVPEGYARRGDVGSLLR